MLRRILVLTFLFSIVIAAMPLVVAQADCDFSISNYARAVQLHDMGDYGRALRHYHCALQENPDDAVIPILIENIHEEFADSSAWSLDRGKASAISCDPAKNHAQLGGAAHDAGNDELAQIHLQCVLLSDGQHSDALYRMGSIHINRGETHEARHYFDRAEAAAALADHDDDLLIHLLGDDARSVLKQVNLDELPLRSPEPAEHGEYLPPGNEYQRTVLRVIWTRGQDQGVDARQADDSYTIGKLEQALRQDPTRDDLRCELGRRYSARGDYAASWGQFSALITETIGDHCGASQRADAPSATPALAESANANSARVSPAEAVFAEGLRYMAEGKKYGAANTFLDALKLDPLHLEARCRLGIIFTEWAHYRGALEQFDFVLQRDPQDSCARHNRTIAARDMLAIFTPLVVDDYFHYARTYIRMGEWELARDAFLEGLSIDPTRSEVRCELGRRYSARGDYAASWGQFSALITETIGDHCGDSQRADSPSATPALAESGMRMADARCELETIRSWAWVMSAPPCGD